MPDLVNEATRLISTTLETAGGPACLTCSFQAEDMVVLDIARRIQPSIPVLFLETGYHFAATTDYRDRMAAEWRLNLINLIPTLSVAEQESQFGILNRTDPSRCCRIRKVEPLMAALDHYSVWLTGLRREQSPTRANLAESEQQILPSGHPILKVSPLAAWKWDDVWNYLGVQGIPHLSLYDEGYPSIGCEPCTSKPLDPANLRSGRWGGLKLECGIHTAAQGG